VTGGRPVVLTVRLTAAEVAALDAAAQLADRPRAWIVRDALRPLFTAYAPPTVPDATAPLPFGR
jgi:hypothetical protein